MTFENKKLSEQKSTSETHPGLIYLNNKESTQDSNETDTSSRQFYNQTRKKQPNKPRNQPQSITQSSRGLTNVTRTLYDPNAPTPKTPTTISLTQPSTTVKITSNPCPPPTPTPAPPLSTNTQQHMQEFYQQ